LNLKTAKRIRQLLRPAFMQFGMTERAAIHENHTVRSRRYNVTIFERAGFEYSHDYPTGQWVIYQPERRMENTATQVRLMRGCPRQQYKAFKRKYNGLSPTRSA